jgi:hypothetical protein
MTGPSRTGKRNTWKIWKVGFERPSPPPFSVKTAEVGSHQSLHI